VSEIFSCNGSLPSSVTLFNRWIRSFCFFDFSNSCRAQGFRNKIPLTRKGALGTLSTPKSNSLSINQSGRSARGRVKDDFKRERISGSADRAQFSAVRRP
jgi:hypothetical protein